jgi:hypothetical protein
MCETGTTEKGKHVVNVGATPSGKRSFKGKIGFGTKLLSSCLKEGKSGFWVVILPKRVAAKT